MADPSNANAPSEPPECDDCGEHHEGYAECPMAPEPSTSCEDLCLDQCIGPCGAFT